MTEFVQPEPLSSLKWLAVDFDGTLCNTEFPEYKMGSPILSAVGQVHKYVFQGWKVAIHTSRPWVDYEAIEAWLNHYEVPFNKIVCGKLLAHRYIDDRAVHPEDEDWTA